MDYPFLTLLAIYVSAIAKGFMDSIAHEKFPNKGIWWNKQRSWKLKYKNNDPKQGAKFFGSTTYLVWTTDGWHLFQLLFLTAIQTAIILNFDFITFWTKENLYILEQLEGDILVPVRSLFEWVWSVIKNPWIKYVFNMAFIKIFFNVTFEIYYKQIHKLGEAMYDSENL